MKNHEGNIEKAFNKLPGSANKVKLREFDRINKSNGLKGASRYSYVNTVRKLMETNTKDFKDMGKEDIIDFLDMIDKEHTGKSPMLIRTTVKSFFKWFNDGETPKTVSWIKSVNGHSRKVMPSDLITPEEVRKMIAKCDYPRDRLIVSLMSELGIRAGEVESIRIKDVVFTDDYALVTVNGKTGPRQLRCYDSEPYLKMCLDMHPDKNNPESPLFVNLSNAAYGKALEYQGIFQLVKKLAKRSGIDTKRITPHVFRHSCLSRMGKSMTDSELRSFAGWSGDSQMSKVYVHLSSSDIQEKQGQIAGKEKAETINTGTLHPTMKCWKCNNKNAENSRFCSVCGAILNKAEREAQRMEAAKEMENKFEQMINEKLNKILKEKGEKLTV